MREPIYALQRDVDMIAEQVQILTISLNKLDWIAQKVKGMEEEQTCQAEQMRRIEAEQIRQAEQMRRIEAEQIRQAEQMRKMEQDIAKILRILDVITKHLGINEAV